MLFGIQDAGEFRRVKTGTTIAVGCMALLCAASSATAQAPAKSTGWQFTVGPGVIYAPSYLGDDEYRARIVPNVSIKYEDQFFASIREGIGYNVIRSDGWLAGPVVKYDFGRDEDGSSMFAVTGSDTDDLRGLGDVDGTVELGGFVKYNRNFWSGSLELRQGVGGHEGLIGDLGVSYSRRIELLGMPAMFSVGPKLTVASDNYTSAYFDVNATQSARSGLAVYDAEGGIVSYGLQGTFVVPLSQSVRLVTFGGIKRLGDEIADSSLVRTRGSDIQASLGASLNYTF